MLFSKEVLALVEDLEELGFGAGKDSEDVMKKLSKNNLKQVIKYQWTVITQIDERLKNAAIYFKNNK